MNDQPTPDSYPPPPGPYPAQPTAYPPAPGPYPAQPTAYAAAAYPPPVPAQHPPPLPPSAVPRPAAAPHQASHAAPESTPFYPLPARRRTGRRVALIAAALVVVLGAAGGVAYATGWRPLSTVAPAAAPTTAPPVGTAAPTPTPTPTAYDGDLAALLVPLPAGAKKLKNTDNPDDILTLDEVVKIDYGGDAQMAEQLKAYSFRRGIAEWYTLPNGTEVHIELLQFDRPSYAERFTHSDELGYHDDAGWTDRSAVAGVDGSGLFTAKKSKNGDWLSAAFAMKATIEVTVFAFEPKTTAGVLAGGLLAAQYALLPA